MITKPLRISKIDWGNPLTRNLISYIACNEMAGVPSDLVPGSKGDGIGGFTWGTNGLYTNAGGSNILFNNTIINIGTGNFTLMSLCSVNSSATISAVPILLFQGSAYVYLGLNRGGSTPTPMSGKFMLGTYNGTTNQVADTVGTSFCDGKLHTYAGIKNNNVGSLYFDGLAATVGTNTIGSHNITGGNPPQSRLAAPAAGLQHTISYAAAWNRALTPAEIAQLHANPWQLLAQSSASRLLRLLSAPFSGVSRGRSLIGISRGRMLG